MPLNFKNGIHGFGFDLLFLIKYLGKQNIAYTICHYEMTGLFKNVQSKCIILFFIAFKQVRSDYTILFE